jgi:hypothetical protein
MEPDALKSRRNPMRGLALLAPALLLPLALTCCGSDDGGRNDVATDSASSSATGTPTVGSYPELAATDYTYRLSVQCFCAFGSSPVQVTVHDGEVASAAYAKDSGGRQDAHAGQPAPKSLWLTINDVIARANDTTAARVTVDWPAGQDYPNSVFVDQNTDMADDEIGYTISDVAVNGG